VGENTKIMRLVHVYAAVFGIARRCSFECYSVILLSRGLFSMSSSSGDDVGIFHPFCLEKAGGVSLNYDRLETER